MTRRAVPLALLAMLMPQAAGAQGIDGSVSLMGDVFPTAQRGATEDTRIGELRARIVLEYRIDLAERVRLTASGFADGLLAHRVAETTTTAGIVRPQELHLDASWARADLRVGMSRIVWGRLDEFLPTDVVNPLDLTRFFLEGRSEARMPVAMVRGRWLPTDRFTIEALYVPFFRRGRFDQLDEPTSPFNLAPPVGLDVVSHEPARTVDHAQGGARASITTGRVDWSVATYRGFETLPLYTTRLTPGSPTPVPVLQEEFPRFTMVGGDFETVRGQWGLRGEVAAFVDRTLQAVGRPDTVEGQTFEAGLGVDRRAGDYRVSGNLVMSRRWADSSSIDRTDVTIVGALDRSFARETRWLRAFGVYNPGERSAFARVTGSLSLRDDLAIEASGGLFAGDGGDALSLLASRDFVYARLKVFF